MIRTNVWRSVALTSLAASLVVACSFPEHSFIPDDEFNNGGNAGNGNAGTGAGTSGGSSGVGGNAGNSSGGTGAVGGDAGAAGTAAQGGTAGTSGEGGSAGIGGGGTGGGGTGGMAGTGGSSGGTGTEDCTNGVDDDGDNKADCEDTKCQSVGYKCFALPAGWQGPVALYEGPDTSKSCSGSYGLGGPGGGKDLNAPNLSCSACSCGSPTGSITCHFPDINVLQGAACSGAGWTFDGASLESGGVTSGACFGSIDPFLGPNGELPGSAETTAPPTTGGSCTPSGGVPTTPNTGWNTNAVSCSQTAAPTGCGANTCVPPTGSAFNRGSCVYQDGDQACPTGGFTFKHLFYTDYDDGRSCSACTCGSPNSVICNGAKLEIWNGASCSGSPEGTVATPGTSCATLTANQEKHFKYTVGTASGGKCDPAGGQPTGSATPKLPITFCCTK